MKSQLFIVGIKISHCFCFRRAPPNLPPRGGIFGNALVKLSFIIEAFQLSSKGGIGGGSSTLYSLYNI